LTMQEIDAKSDIDNGFVEEVDDDDDLYNTN
jgi:hypothetical protein